ncbi:MAG: TonB-dependent receptor [Bryobacterales bacterium]|nr:TonB-dependent receptor [Bryobacterales bacterium]
MSLLRTFALLLLMAISAGFATGQVLYGSLVGNISDPSRAAIPGASVRLTNMRTGISIETTADATGGYQFRNVQSGTYEVECTATGFKGYRRSPVEVPSNEIVRIDIALELGEVSQMVVVTTESPLLQTDRSDVRKEMSSQDLNNLPVPGYRNFQSLMGLVPGVTPPVTSNSIAGNPAGSLVANVNGASNSNNNTRVDGASNTYLWLPHLTAYVPPLESIGSVNIVTNSYDAEQGLAAGAIVSVETRSGSNEFHGSAFNYHTNSRLRARNVFNTSTATLPKNIINQYGGTLGGPIRKNSLFFFTSYEGMNQRQNFSRFATIPTPQHRTGDFSDTPTQIYDPLTGNANGTGRQAFAGQRIPVGRQNQVATRILGMLPNPSFSDRFAQNLFASAPMKIDRENWDLKLNWNATSNTILFGRYAIFDYATYDPATLGAAGGRGVASTFPGNDTGTIHSFTMGGSHTFTPTLLFDGHFGFTEQNQNGNDEFFGRNVGLDDFGLPGTNGPTINESGFPGFQVSGYEGMGGYISSSPRFRTDRQFQYSANMGWTKGRHNLRWGAELANQHMNHYQPAGTFGPRGGFNFAGGITGLNGGPAPNQFNSLGGFLLGLPNTLGKSIPTSDFMRTRLWNMGFYFRDRWEVSRSVTLNLGMRWEYYPMVERDTRGVERYDWTTNQMLIGGVGSTPTDTGVWLSKKLFAPRIGLAWRVDDKTVVRTGYGISIDPFPLAIPLRSSYPTVIEQSRVSPNTFSFAGLLEDGIPLPTLPDISSGSIPLPASVTTLTMEQRFNRGYVQSYNFTVQRQLGRGYVAQAGYVGSRSIRLTNRRDLNAAPPGTGAAGRPYFAAFGRNVATTLHEPAYTSTYDSFQAQLDRRFTNGFSFGLAYTFSKAIGFGENNDSGLFFNHPSVLDRNRSLLAFDRPHNLRLSSVYELPFGKGKPWADSGFLSKLAGGWQVNGIFSAYSGSPFTVTSSGASLNAPGNSQVADQVKDRVQILGGTGPGQSWFDPLAFAPITTARFGNAGLSNLRGPNFVNLDMGVFRNFAITERFNLQFRAEAFNATNTPHFNNPGTNVSSLAFNPDGSIRTLGGYTEINSAQADERQFRFALRLSF